MPDRNRKRRLYFVENKGVGALSEAGKRGREQKIGYDLNKNENKVKGEARKYSQGCSIPIRRIKSSREGSFFYA